MMRMENVVFVHRGICCHCFIACPAHAHRFVPLLYVSCYMQLHELLAFFIYSDALMECAGSSALIILWRLILGLCVCP